MNIFFGFNTSRKITKSSPLYKIRGTVLSTGNNLIMDQLHLSKEQEEDMIQIATQSINKAELAILEVTELGFDTGYLINLASMKKIPTLLLIEKTALVKPEVNDILKQLSQSYTNTKRYYVSTIEAIIISFIAQNSTKQISRFNLMLDRRQRDYLEWADSFYRRSKSDLIRDLVDNKSENDLNYQHFHKNVT